MGFEFAVGLVINPDLNMSVPERNQVATELNPLSPNVLKSAGFPLFEHMLSFRSQNHKEIPEPDVLQVRQSEFLPSGPFPFFPCDVVPFDQFLVDVGRDLAVRNLADHIPPVSSTDIRNGQLLNEAFQCRGFAFVLLHAPPTKKRKFV